MNSSAAVTPFVRARRALLISIELRRFMAAGVAVVIALSIMGCDPGPSNKSGSYDPPPTHESTQPGKVPSNISTPTPVETPIDPTPEKPGSEPKVEPSNPITSNREQPKLTAADWAGVEERVMQSKGKIVVIDIWSTSCEPCLRELPHLVTLQKKFPDDVVAISYDCDYIGVKSKPVDFYRERVLKALSGVGADVILNLMATAPADELFEQLKLDSIPAAYVFGRDGKLVKRFDNTTPASPTEEGISYETQIIPLVTSLVKGESP